jgi:hypothetical protein
MKIFTQIGKLSQELFSKSQVEGVFSPGKPWWQAGPRGQEV